jgi:hypothetical protein
MSSHHEDIEFEVVRHDNEPTHTENSEFHSVKKTEIKNLVRKSDTPKSSIINSTTTEPNSTEGERKKSISLLKIFLGDYMDNDKFKSMMPYVIFVTILAILYIYNGFANNAKHRQKAQLTEQIKELRSKSMAFNALKMQAIQRSSILNKCNEFGLELEESVTPHKIVEK